MSKLDEDTRINVIADCARRRILTAHDDISYLEMVYPGNVIPPWFSRRARGKSFIQLPPNWLNTDDSRFKFVFGAVFAFKISGPEIKSDSDSISRPAWTVVSAVLSIMKMFARFK
nr:uncharacterized protein LOC125423358 [Ziziphus jujuba var. spinosa]